MSDCVMSRHTLGTTVSSYSSVSNLYVLIFIFKIFKSIESSALCEAQQVIPFPSWRYLSAASIFKQICEVYRAAAIYESKVRKSNRNFKAGSDSFGWEMFSHSLYSLDLMLSDFHLFCYLKLQLRPRSYNKLECWGHHKTFIYIMKI